MYKDHEDRSGGEPNEPHAVVTIGQFVYNHINVVTKCENCGDGKLQEYIVNFFAASIADAMMAVVAVLRSRGMEVVMEDPREALDGALVQISELKEKLDAEANGRSDNTTSH